jgi:hypothetical protein
VEIKHLAMAMAADVAELRGVHESSVSPKDVAAYFQEMIESGKHYDDRVSLTALTPVARLVPWLASVIADLIDRESTDGCDHSAWIGNHRALSVSESLQRIRKISWRLRGIAEWAQEWGEVPMPPASYEPWGKGWSWEEADRARGQWGHRIDPSMQKFHLTSGSQDQLRKLTGKSVKYIFGEGLYFAPTQRKAKFYSTGMAQAVPVKVVLFNPYVIDPWRLAPPSPTNVTDKDFDPEKIRRAGHDGIIGRTLIRYGWSYENIGYGVVFPEYIERAVTMGERAPRRRLSGWQEGARVKYTPQPHSQLLTSIARGDIGKITWVYQNDMVDVDFHKAGTTPRVRARREDFTLVPGKHAELVLEAQRRGGRVPPDPAIEYGAHEPDKDLALKHLGRARQRAKDIWELTRTMYEEGRAGGSAQLATECVSVLRGLRSVMLEIAKAARHMASKWGRIFEYSAKYLPMPGDGRKPWLYRIPAGWEGTTEQEQGLHEEWQSYVEKWGRTPPGQDPDPPKPTEMTHIEARYLYETLGQVEEAMKAWQLKRAEGLLEGIHGDIESMLWSWPVQWRKGMQFMAESPKAAWRRNPSR